MALYDAGFLALNFMQHLSVVSRDNFVPAPVESAAAYYCLLQAYKARTRSFKAAAGLEDDDDSSDESDDDKKQSEADR